MKKGLGRGLDILFKTEETDKQGVVMLKLTDIEPNKFQPRKNFKDDKLEALAQSIREHGVIQPIIVKQTAGETYQIIAGERRWRAARLAGIKEIPVIIKEYDNKEVMEIALIENIQREDLNPVEEALAYKNLVEEYSVTQEEISKRVGKSRPYIANMLRLLNLSEDLKNLLVQEKISTGHAKALLSVEDHLIQKELAEQIIKHDLTVRQTEKAIQSMKVKAPDVKEPLSIYHVEIANRLAENFGTKVTITSMKNKGKIEIHYFSDDDLQRLLEILER